jgi:hypothetical protein
MSPELQRLIEAYDAKLSSPPSEKPQRLANFERLLHDALAKLPGTNRDALLEAIQSRYLEFRKARRKPTALPPNA